LSLSLLATAVLGTKAAIAGTAILVLAYLFFKNLTLRKLAYASGCVLVGNAAIALIALELMPVPVAAERFLVYTAKQLRVIDSLFSVVISARDLKLKYLLSLFSEHTPWVLFSGGGAGVGVAPSELDWFDLFFIGGPPLLFFVFWPPLSKIAYSHIPSPKKTLALCLFISTCFVAFWGGHIVYSAVTSMAFMATFSLILQKETHEH
ncbi:MAG: hypothetical protein AAGB31_15770, partial [Bdellovibrio sp.]